VDDPAGCSGIVCKSAAVIEKQARRKAVKACRTLTAYQHD